MRHLLSLFALALVPAHVPAIASVHSGASTNPFLRIYEAPRVLSAGVSVPVKAQLSTTASFSSWWWGSNVWFTSSNTNVFTVTDAGWGSGSGVVGTVTAVAPGSAWLIVHDENGTTASAQIQVTAGSGAPLASVRIQCSNGAWCDKESGRTVSVGRSQSQQLFVVGLDASGNVLWKAPVQ